MKKSTLKNSFKKTIWGIMGTVMMCGIIFMSKNTAGAADNPPAPTDALVQSPTPAPSNEPVQTSAPAVPIVTVAPQGANYDLNIIRSGDYGYQVLNKTDKTASLRRVYNYAENVVLPTEVDGYKIVDIGLAGDEEHYYKDEVLTVFSEENNNIRSLVIPEGVLNIEVGAFCYMKNLEKLSLPESLVGAGGEIHSRNFDGITKLSELNIPEGLYVYCCFEDSVIDKLTVNGSIYGDDEVGMMRAKVNTMIVKRGKKGTGFCNGNKRIKENRDNVFIAMGGKVKNVIVSSNIKKIKFQDGDYENIKLENANTVVSYDYPTFIGKVTADIANINSKKSGGKTIYSWKALNVTCYTEDYEAEKEIFYNKCVYKIDKKGKKASYKVSTKNKSGKYKTVKSMKKTKIKLAHKSKVKVTAVIKCSKRPEPVNYPIPVPVEAPVTVAN
jgi:hypothetical protein